jgi:hypothetical protein
MALSQSSPTPNTSEPVSEVVSATEGAPLAALADADEPTVESAPANATTVIEPSQDPDARVAVTIVLARVLGA